MKILRFLSIGVLAAPAALAQSAPSDLAARFGARESIRNVSLSADGTKVAIVVATAGQGTALVIGDLVAGGQPTSIFTSSGVADRLRRCDWATSKRLICVLSLVTTATGQRLNFSRLFAIDSDGSDMKVLSVRSSGRELGIIQDGGTLLDWGSDAEAGTVLMTRQFVPEDTIGTLVTRSRSGLGVEQVDTISLKRTLVEPPRADAVEYITDGHGTVRIFGSRPRTPAGYSGSKIAYFYRKAGSREWLPLGELTIGAQTSSGFNPITVDRDLNVVYGYDKVDGRQALFRISLDGSMKKEMMLARPDVDIDDLITLGRHRRVVGVSYATDKRVAEYFDPAISRTRDTISRAIAGKSVDITDASGSEDKLLMFTGSDVDPGRYYLFDKGSRKLAEVLPVRPQLDRMALASVKPITYPAADGTMIPGYLTLPPGLATAKGLPAIVMPHGGPTARDEWGFDWLSQYYAARGYAVLQPNFRGSAGYGDAWFQKNGFQSWHVAVGDVNDGGRWLVAQGIADPAKLAIVGWSYGGYAALQSPALAPALFKAIVAIAPVTDLDALREEAKDYSNYNLVDAFIGRGPHIREGSPARNAKGITAPVMLLHGTRDENVGVGESRLMVSRLSDAGHPATYIEFEGLDHYLDDAAARTRLLRESDAFLRKAIGMPAG